APPAADTAAFGCAGGANAHADGETPRRRGGTPVGPEPVGVCGAVCVDTDAGRMADRAAANERSGVVAGHEFPPGVAGVCRVHGSGMDDRRRGRRDPGVATPYFKEVGMSRFREELR